MSHIVPNNTLPQVIARPKGDSQFTAYANAYVIGKRGELMRSGYAKWPLWYLSFIVPKGQGSTAEAIANTLFDANNRSVFIDGVGEVALGNRRQDLQDLGYSVHWTCQMEAVEDGLHVVIESPFLTSFDPFKAEQLTLSRSRRKPHGKGREKKKAKSSIMATGDAAPSADVAELEAQQRELKPLFLLLEPGETPIERRAYLQHLHLTYLENRCPFALIDEWESYLWDRAIDQKEIEPLQAWGYTYQERSREEEFIPINSAHPYGSSVPVCPASTSVKDLPYRPAIVNAYLCLPNISKMHVDLQNWLVAQHTDTVTEESEMVAA